jgi:Domain of unknown function (DUF4129)
VNWISSRGRVAILFGLIALAVLVGIGSRPGGIELGGPVPPLQPFEVLVQTGLYVVIALDLLLIAGLVYVFWPSEPRQLNRAVKLALLMMPILLLVLTIGLFVAAAPFGRGLVGPPSGSTSADPAALPQTNPPLSTVMRSADSVLLWISLGFTAAVVVIGLLAWVISERRRRMPGQVRASERPDTVSEAIEEGIETLLSHPDPRQAVIAAYSVMEKAFARAGRARRHFEAPLEFVGRILSSVPGAGADATKLAELFELAKFSQHEINENMRGVAVSALSNIRRQLQVPT